MKKPKARQRILDTARELFMERGYTSVGINEIIDKAETAKASFYHHFSSKEKLCETWLEETHEFSMIFQKSVIEAEGDPREKIIGYFEVLREWLTKNDYRGCPYTNTAATGDSCSPAIASQIELHKLSIRDFFIELASQAFADSYEAEMIGRSLFLIYSGATTESQNLRSGWPVDSAIEAVERLLANSTAMVS